MSYSNIEEGSVSDEGQEKAIQAKDSLHHELSIFLFSI